MRIYAAEHRGTYAKLCAFEDIRLGSCIGDAGRIWCAIAYERVPRADILMGGLILEAS